MRLDPWWVVALILGWIDTVTSFSSYYCYHRPPSIVINNIMTVATTRRRSHRLAASNNNSNSSDLITISSSDDGGTAAEPVPERPKRQITKKRAAAPKEATVMVEAASSKKRQSRTSARTASAALGEVQQPIAASSKQECFNRNDKEEDFLANTLPRTLETALRNKITTGSADDLGIEHVLGVDEAGRGPLAGPVVVAAICLDAAAPRIPGIVDSKRITSERGREALYEQIIMSMGARWAVAVVDAAKIDEINILQATLLGMRLVVETLVIQSSSTTTMTTTAQEDNLELEYPIRSEACISHTGCYVVCSSNNHGSARAVAVARKTKEVTKSTKVTDDASLTASTTYNNPINSKFYALIDGNRVPDSMPCPAQAIVKGDGREYCIAAASILAKVTRDRLMHAYDAKYPEYGLKQHKGYPTKAHREAVLAHGASPIHRMTFAPLKHMAKLD